METNKTREDVTSGFLEKFNGSGYTYDLDAEHAAIVNAELEELENWEHKQGIPLHVLEEDEEIVVDSEAEKAFWEKLDMPLHTIVERIFARSLRPFVIIRDDKIEYVNQTLLKLMGLHSPKQMVGKSFFEFVAKDDWNNLAENIGEMLTEDHSLAVRMKRADRKVIELRMYAVYIPDSEHFSFILFGEESHENKSADGQDLKEPAQTLFDELTALPSFYLFEDRVQMAVNAEIYKDVRLPKNVIGVAGVYIENMDYFQKLNLDEFVLKKLASRLVLGMRKNYTVARGLKCQFGVLFNDLANVSDLEVELHKLIMLVQENVEDNFHSHEISACIGLSVFPEPARSAKKLLQQAVYAVGKARELHLPYYKYDGADFDEESE